MYIHLGNNYIIYSQNIIAILNLDPPIAEDIQDIMEIARSEKKLVNISEKGKDKSLVICDDKVYLSPISSHTLFKRAALFAQEVWK
ncbi:MAG: extracellular matrix regulator RemB [Syntrophomonadaceae bacterium]|mgnify:CR=1 FL=1|nr:DUF370 domain-containing protein [Bacillota bacterium]NLM87289.1 DUF370 domain-containing protein [Syntrophomonadaceae bacterium]HAA09419.1 DUF370 domain-containing protein [Syntrophomonas sp.]HQD89536.1 DUF370 domain-containing protein [Syntrophomonadaceae bacterium]